VLIGTLYTTSDFVTSKFADEKMFFRHNLMELDVNENVKASWLEYVPTWSFLGWDLDSEKKEGACPFASLWN